MLQRLLSSILPSGPQSSSDANLLAKPCGESAHLLAKRDDPVVRMQTHTVLRSNAPFEWLPDDLLGVLMPMMPFESVLHLRLTCKRMHAAAGRHFQDHLARLDDEAALGWDDGPEGREYHDIHLAPCSAPTKDELVAKVMDDYNDDRVSDAAFERVLRKRGRAYAPPLSPTSSYSDHCDDDVDSDNDRGMFTGEFSRRTSRCTSAQCVVTIRAAIEEFRVSLVRSQLPRHQPNAAPLATSFWQVLFGLLARLSARAQPVMMTLSSAEGREDIGYDSRGFTYCSWSFQLSDRCCFTLGVDTRFDDWNASSSSNPTLVLAGHC